MVISPSTKIHLVISIPFNLVFMHNLISIPFSSLEEIWVAVLNITGPLSSWSFADNVLPGTKIVSST